MNVLENYERVAVRWEGPYSDAKDDAECYCGKCDLFLEDDDWNFCPKCGVELLRFNYEQRYKYLADIGIAIEKVFEQKNAKYLEIRDKDECLILFSEGIQELIDWAKSQKSEESEISDED